MPELSLRTEEAAQVQQRSASLTASDAHSPYSPWASTSGRVAPESEVCSPSYAAPWSTCTNNSSRCKVQSCAEGKHEGQPKHGHHAESSSRGTSVQASFITSEVVYIAALKTLLTAYLMPLSNVGTLSADVQLKVHSGASRLTHAAAEVADGSRQLWRWRFGRGGRLSDAQTGSPAPQPPLKHRWWSRGTSQASMGPPGGGTADDPESNPLILLETLGGDLLKLIACHVALQNELLTSDGAADADERDANGTGAEDDQLGWSDDGADARGVGIDIALPDFLLSSSCGVARSTSVGLSPKCFTSSQTLRAVATSPNSVLRSRCRRSNSGPAARWNAPPTRGDDGGESRKRTKTVPPSPSAPGSMRQPPLSPQGSREAAEWGKMLSIGDDDNDASGAGCSMWPSTPCGGKQRPAPMVPFPLALVKIVPLMRVAYSDYIMRFQRNVSLADRAWRRVSTDLWPSNYLSLARAVLAEQIRLLGVTAEHEAEELAEGVDVSFESLVTLPVQRIARYPLLLSEWMESDAGAAARDSVCTSHSRRLAAHLVSKAEADLILLWEAAEEAALEAHEAILDICTVVDRGQAMLRNAQKIQRVEREYGVVGRLSTSPAKVLISDGFYAIRSAPWAASGSDDASARRTATRTPIDDAPGALLLFRDGCDIVEYTDATRQTVKQITSVPLKHIHSVRFVSSYILQQHQSPPPTPGSADGCSEGDPAGVYLSYVAPLERSLSMPSCLTPPWSSRVTSRYSDTSSSMGESVECVGKQVLLVGEREADMVLLVRDMTDLIDRYYADEEEDRDGEATRLAEPPGLPHSTPDAAEKWNIKAM